MAAPVSGWKATASAAYAEVGAASAPPTWFAPTVGGQSPYVRLVLATASTADTEPTDIVLKVRPTTHAGTTYLVVTPGVLGLDQGDEAAVVATPMSAGAYRKQWLLRSGAGKWTIAGLALAAVGQLISIALEAGKGWSVVDLDAKQIAALNTAKGALTLIGLGVAFWLTMIKA